ncbi:MAG: M20 family metallopeptidase [Thermodesulfobacteriota bacterium]|nr:M20 family metallopeptidase [Thermodesulfobacteriota bacterium]
MRKEISRETAIAKAEKYFDNGFFFKDLARRVAYPTESQNKDRVSELRDYLEKEIWPYLEKMGFTCRIVENPIIDRIPSLIAQRVEDETLPTVLTYGHGDTVWGMESAWRPGLEPWRLAKEGDRWYGRGAADNKGQHTINLAALNLLLRERGELGFNVKILIEMGEEMGSPGLHEICAQEKDALMADVLIASDGPRINPDKPTVFGGSRGVFNFDISLKLREGEHHSGNWGGLLANPGIILAHAISSMVDSRGRILIEGLRPDGIPEPIQKALAELEVTGAQGPDIDVDWGEPGLSLAEKVYGWNTLDVLAFECGNPANPVHAIPSSAWARCHIRYVAGSHPQGFIAAVRKHLEEHGLEQIQITEIENQYGMATRLSPDNPWVKWTIGSFEKTTDKKTAFLPNLGGTLPNDAFTDILGLPTIWVPHSYGGCSQHAPNEHLLAPIAREGLRLMTGLFWDLAENPPIDTTD